LKMNTTGPQLSASASCKIRQVDQLGAEGAAPRRAAAGGRGDIPARRQPQDIHTHTHPPRPRAHCGHHRVDHHERHRPRSDAHESRDDKLSLDQRMRAQLPPLLAILLIVYMASYTPGKSWRKLRTSRALRRQAGWLAGRRGGQSTATTGEQQLRARSTNTLSTHTCQPPPPACEAVDCFKCSSRNGSNPDCEDPFHNVNTTRVVSAVLPEPHPNVIYHTPCYAGKKGRKGVFPASACIKLTGVFGKYHNTRARAVPFSSYFPFRKEIILD
jgi:hypothetical protein